MAKDRQAPVEQEQPDYPLELLPTEAALQSAGYSPQIIKNYLNLTVHDTHLAEVYRVSSRLKPERKRLKKPPHKPTGLNPLQAYIDKDGQVWVSVLFALKEDASPDALKELMNIQAISGRLVSGQVRADNLPALSELTNRLRTGRAVQAQLYHSVFAMHADRAALAATFPGETPDGSGTIIGVVDVGCDFNHKAFLDNAGQSRLLFLWDQNGTSPHPASTVAYGVEYDQAMINTALQTQPDPYTVLGYKPEPDFEARHGTHVMGIAAGGLAQYPGVAPQADLIFVHLGNPANLANYLGPDAEELKSLGSSTCLFDAVKYIFDKVDAINANLPDGSPPRPVVVNLSLGTNGGAHDGSSTLELLFDDLLRNKPGRAIVIAAGNSYDDEIHTCGEIAANGTKTIDWFVERRGNYDWDLRQELEIWYDPNAKLSMELFDRDGLSVGSCDLGKTKTTSVANVPAQPVIISHLPPDAAPGEDQNHIDILLDNRYPDLKLGKWSVRLTNLTGQAVTYQAWIEKNPRYPSHFSPSSSQSESTINGIANAELPLVVGAYYTDLSEQEICYFSSAGPSLNQHSPQKPDISAPGENILAPSALCSNRMDNEVRTGTSMATPHVSGLVALMFQRAALKKKTLTMNDIREFLASTADKSLNPNGSNFDRQVGSGIVNAVEALKKI